MPWRDPLPGEMKPFDQVEYREYSEPEEPSGPALKGNIRKHLSVWCGDCSEWRHLESKKMETAAFEARHYGWSFTKERGWICPECRGAQR